MNKQYHVKLNGELIPVEEAVYRTYQQAKWREKKQKQVRKEKECSYDFLCEIGLDLISDSTQCTLEEIILDSMLVKEVTEVIATLNDNERHLMHFLIHKNKSERDFARQLSISRKTLAYRKHKLLEKIRKAIDVG